MESIVSHGVTANANDEGSNTMLDEAVFDRKENVAKRNSTLHEAVLNKNATIVNELLLNDVDVNIADTYGRTPLFYASNVGDISIAGVLLDNGADVNKAVDINETPLRTALLSGIMPMVELMLKYNANVNKPDRDGNTPLHLAVCLDTTIVELLLNYKANINLTNKCKETPLHLAVKCEKMTIAEILLKRGANVNASDTNDYTPIHLAVQRGSITLVNILLSYEADVNMANVDGITPLYNAVHREDFHIADILIRRGADVNKTTNTGSTPLLRAAYSGKSPLVEQLIQHKADVNCADINGITPLEAAVSCGNAAVVASLLNSKAKVNVTGKFGTPLHLAAGLGDAPVVKLLLNNKTNINIKTNAQNTPLHLAVNFAKLSVIDILLQRGAEVNTVNKESITPLHIAVARKDMQIIQMLLDSKADINMANITGETSLHLAVHHREPSLVELLLRHGVDVNIARNDGNTSLHLAIDYEVEIIVERLLDYDADIFVENSNNITPLQLSLERKSGKIVELLNAAKLKHDAGNLISKDEKTLPQIDRNETSMEAFISAVDSSDAFISAVDSNDNTSSLHWAVERGEISVTEQLLQNGANVNETNKNGYTALHIAILHGKACTRMYDMVSLLLRYGAEVNSLLQLETGVVTPLLLTTYYGMASVVDLLLNYNADVNKAADFNGDYPIHIAIEKCHEVIVKSLLKWEADINVTDIENTTPLHLAQIHEVSISIVEMLLRRGANVNSKDNYNTTPLHLAAEKEKVPNVELLLKFRADSKIVDKSGNTALHLAARKGNVEITVMLLNFGAEFNSINYYGITPLYAAIQSGNAAVVKLLMKCGIETINMNIDNNIPLHLAVHQDKKIIVKMLIKYGADINVMCRDRFTPLHAAVYKKNIHLVEMLLNFGAKVNSTNIIGITPLLEAVRNGSVAIADMLLEYGSDLTTTATDGNTLLHEAVRLRKSSMVELLLRYHTEVNSKNNFGETPLHTAARHGTESIADLLIKHGADFNTTDNSGNTALHFAIGGRNAPVVQLLLNRGANVNISNIYGNTILHTAVLSGEKYIVQMLLNSNSEGNLFSKTNFKNSMGNTAIHLAAYTSYGNIAILQLLINFGARIDLQNVDGDTPLHMACRSNVVSIVDLLLSSCSAVHIRNSTGDTPLHLAARYGDTDIVNSMLRRGADVTKVNSYGDTALHMAARGAAADLLELLLRGGADPNATNIYGDTSLHVATRGGQITIVELLIKHGAHVDASNYIGNTALHYMSNSQYTSIATLLFRCGANPNVMNKFNDTPLHIAAQSGNTSAVELLLEFNIDVNTVGSAGDTPLHKAVSSRALSTVDVLLRNGADRNITNSVGATPVHLSVCLNEVPIFNLLLLNGGAGITTSRDGNTPLHEAAGTGKEVIVDLLLNKQVDVNARNRNGSTPLHLAACNGEPSTAAQLVRCSADINAIDNDGNTPIHLAVLQGHTTIVHLLLRRGANVALKNLERNSPLTIARVFYQQRDEKIIHLLKTLENPTSTASTTNESFIDINTIFQSTNYPKNSNNQLENSNTQFKYSKKTETSGIRGQWYETKLLSLVHIRALNDEHIEQFHLGTNMCDVGDIDDICMRYRVRGRARPVLLFVQAKHREDRDKGLLSEKDVRNAVGDFSLQKYFNTYLTIKKRFQSNTKDPMFEGDFNDIDCNLVIYTPAKDCLNKKKTDVKVSERVHHLINTERNTDCFQYHWDEVDIKILANIRVVQELEKLGAAFIPYIMSDTENLDVLNNEVIASYHVYLRIYVLRACRAKPMNDKYRVWIFRPELFNSSCENLNALKKIFVKELLTKRRDQSEITDKDKEHFVEVTQNPCARTISLIIGKLATYNNKTQKLEVYEISAFKKKFKSNEFKTLLETFNQINVDDRIISEAVFIKLMSIEIKFPLAFGNMDMTFRGDDQKVQSRIASVAKKLISLFKNNQDMMILDINDDDVGPRKSIERSIVAINSGIGSAVGNLLILDKNTNMLKFNLDTKLLPEKAALFLEELKKYKNMLFLKELEEYKAVSCLKESNKIEPKNKELSIYRINVNVTGFPKVCIVENEDNKRQAKEFLSKLWFYVNQAKEDEVEYILYKHINKYYNNVNKANQIKFNVHPRAIYLQSYEKIQNLWMETKKAEYLTKSDDIFGRAKLDCTYDILMTFINYMYSSKIYTMKLKFNNFVQQESALDLTLDRLFEIFDTQNETIDVKDRKDILNLVHRVELLVNDNISFNCSQIFYNVLQDYDDHVKSISNNTLQNPLLKNEYIKRAGTAGIKGQLYKTKLLHLILLRALIDPEIEFLLATNIQDIGDMDDICLRYQVQGHERPVILFVQAKHRDKQDDSKLSLGSLRSATGEFSLQKYFKSYLIIRDRFEANNRDPMFHGHFTDIDCHLILYTPAQDSLSRKETMRAVSEKLQQLMSTKKDTSCFQFEHREDDVNVLSKIAVKEDLKKLAKNILDLITTKNNLDIVSMNKLMARYHVVLAREMLKQCREQQLNTGYRIWEFRQDFFNRDCEYLITLKKEIVKEISTKRFDQSEITKEDIGNCRQFLVNISGPTLSKIIGKLVKFDRKTKKLSFFSDMCTIGEFQVLQEQLHEVNINEKCIFEAVNIKLTGIQIKLPIVFGNIDMTFADENAAQKLIIDMACEVNHLLKINESTKIVDISYDGIIKEDTIVNSGFERAIGNALVRDPVTKMLMFDLDNQTLPVNAALFLKELKSNKYNINGTLSSYRFKSCNRFPKTSFEEDENDKKAATDFFSKFWLYTNQAKDNDVERLLMEELNTYYDIKFGKKRIRCVNTSNNIISFTSDEILKWKIQISGSSYLDRLCDFFERAELIDIDSILLSAINFMYVTKNYSTDIRFTQNLSEPDKFKQMHRIFKKVSNRLFKLFDSEFEDNFSIILPNPYLSLPYRCWMKGSTCKFGELLGFSLEVHPEMEWVAMRLWAFSEDTKYVLVARAGPKNKECDRPRDEFLLKQLYNGRHVYYINGKERQSPEISLPSLGTV